MPLGILIDKEFQDIDQVFIPIFKSDDSFWLIMQKLIYNNNKNHHSGCKRTCKE
jgi:hypothetical protein